MKLINKCLALFVKPKQKPNKELLPIVRTSSPACTKPHVVRRFICVFLGHKAKNKFCQRCGQEFGIPKYNAPPPPPKRVIT